MPAGVRGFISFHLMRQHQISSANGASDCRQSLAEFFRRSEKRNIVSFLRRHVRRRKHFSRNECRNVRKDRTLRHRVQCSPSRRQSHVDFVCDLNGAQNEHRFFETVRKPLSPCLPLTREMVKTKFLTEAAAFIRSTALHIPAPPLCKGWLG